MQDPQPLTPFEKMTFDGLPFKYAVLDEFLSLQELNTLQLFYQDLEFKEIHRDLFRFLQSNELASDERLGFFKDQLDAVLCTKDAFYTIFASFYRAGDFLLCHDDMIDERLYAFTFYLEDFESGDLILYENDCETIHKRVEVKRNRLVIFEVEQNSYHEVDYCKASGRKAITGWLNIKDRKNMSKEIERNYLVDKNTVLFDLPINLSSEEFVCMEFQDVGCKETSRRLCGPFVDRRVYSIELEAFYTPNIEGYELLHNEYLEIGPGCYILCNDKVNLITESILDVFIFSESSEEVSGFIKYVSEEPFEIDAIPGYLFAGLRNGNHLCVNRSEKRVFFKHFIYRKLPVNTE